jgi:predicted DCC family thiol-disulfide oxidoreductase YuxK
MQQAESEEILLVYDKECPVCHTYCQNVQIRKTAGDLKIVDAREKSEVMDEITARGLDIDQGMVLLKDGNLFYGADAIHELSLLSDRSNVFNRLNYSTFRSKSISDVLYPLLRAGRNLLLKILGKTKINNLELKDNRYF